MSYDLAGRQISVTDAKATHHIQSIENGQYRFGFMLPLNAISGKYNVKVGGEGITIPLALSFTHTSIIVPETTPKPSPGPTQTTEPTPIPEPTQGTDVVDVEYTIERNSNNEFKLVISATNTLTFTDKVYVLDYDSNVIMPTSYSGLQCDNSVELGIHNNIHILSDIDGKIRFSIINSAIPPDKVWNGIINVFKFKFKSEKGGIASFLFYKE